MIKLSRHFLGHWWRGKKLSNDNLASVKSSYPAGWVIIALSDNSAIRQSWNKVGDPFPEEWRGLSGDMTFKGKNMNFGGRKFGKKLYRRLWGSVRVRVFSTDVRNGRWRFVKYLILNPRCAKIKKKYGRKPESHGCEWALSVLWEERDPIVNYEINCVYPTKACFDTKPNDEAL